MATILCPTRGGQSSVPNQRGAIALAKEQQAALIFLYISNIQFLNRVSSPVLVNVARELDEMGEFLLAMAVERAREEGVEAESVVRQGEFRQNLLETVSEMGVDTVVIGKAVRDTGLLTDEYLAELARAVNELGAEMFVVDEGEIVNRYLPD